MRLFSAAVHTDFGLICTLSLFDEASNSGLPTRVVLPVSLEIMIQDLATMPNLVSAVPRIDEASLEIYEDL